MGIRAWQASFGVVVGLGFAAVLALTAFAIADSWGGHYWVFGCVAGTVVCALALLRRRDQRWTAVTGLAVAAVAILIARAADLPAEPGPAIALGLSVLIGSTIRSLPAAWASAVAAGGFAIVAVSGWLATPATASGVPAVTVLNGTAWLAALTTGLGLRLLDTRRQAIVDGVRRDERLDLARELHDVVAHHITGIVLQTQAARIVRRRQPERLDDALAGIETAGSDALAAMRRVVGLLRDTGDAAPAKPGPEQLSELVARFDGPAVRLRLPDDEPDWPPEVTSTIYRVVQESLTNVAQHAPRARTVMVDVAQDRQAVTVEVVDDSPTAASRHPGRNGYGLIGMRERVEALGGTLRAGPRSGDGWSVLAVLPLRESG